MPSQPLPYVGVSWKEHYRASHSPKSQPVASPQSVHTTLTKKMAYSTARDSKRSLSEWTAKRNDVKEEKLDHVPNGIDKINKVVFSISECSHKISIAVVTTSLKI